MNLLGTDKGLYERGWYDGPTTVAVRDYDGRQDDETGPLGLLAAPMAPVQRGVAATLQWYEDHQTAKQIGFNPDGMCLKICRTARNIGAVYPSALAAQQATPEAHRIRNLADVKPGHVMFFDDPRDGNPYGHIVTVFSAPERPKRLSEIGVWTNSVVKGRLVKVAASYFPERWGDPWTFAADWLNGQELIMPTPPPPAASTRGPRVDAALKRLLAARPKPTNRAHVESAIESLTAIEPWPRKKETTP